MFYQTFLDLTNDKLPFIVDDESAKLFKDRNFSKFMIEKEESVFAIKVMSYIMHHGILKPQQLLIDNEDYYVAIDCFTNTYYICYRDLMMIDVDRYKINNRMNVDILEDIKLKLKNYPQYFFRIYQSRNGYHIFIINKSMNYRDEETIKLQLELGSDFYYTVFCYLRGWSVRLNKKKGEDNNDILYTWIGDVVKGHFFRAPSVNDNNINETEQTLSDFELNENIDLDMFNSILPDPRLEELTELHLRLVDVFKDTGFNSMSAPE